MKKILVSILLVSYAFASSGASVDLHYCMGKLIGWDFDYNSKSDCGNCGMQLKPAKGCCDNKQINPKIDKEQQVVYNNISFNSDFAAILPALYLLNNIAYSSTIVAHSSIHGPPLISLASLYLFNCNFRM
jgi:hypothetical protein